MEVLHIWLIICIINLSIDNFGTKKPPFIMLWKKEGTEYKVER